MKMWKHCISKDLRYNAFVLDKCKFFGIIKVLEGLPNLLRVFREGLA